MSEKKVGRLSKVASAVGGAGKAAAKRKAKQALSTAAKPLTDAVAAKAEEVGQKAVKAVEEKATIWPFEETEGYLEFPFPELPSAAALTNSVSPVSRSRTQTFESTKNATDRPSAESDGRGVEAK